MCQPLWYAARKFFQPRQRVYVVGSTSDVALVDTDSSSQAHMTPPLLAARITLTGEKMRVYRDSNGRAYQEMEVAGAGKCGPLVLAAANMLEVERLPWWVVSDTVSGEITPRVDAFVASIRRRVVDRSRGHILCRFNIDAFKGEDRRSNKFERALQNARFDIRTRGLWEKVMSHLEGWVDDTFLLLGAEELGLDLEVVVVRKDGKLAPKDSRGSAPNGCRYLAVWDQQGHFTLAVRKVSCENLLIQGEGWGCCRGNDRKT